MLNLTKTKHHINSTVVCSTIMRLSFLQNFNSYAWVIQQLTGYDHLCNWQKVNSVIVSTVFIQSPFLKIGMMLASFQSCCTSSLFRMKQW